MMTEQTLRDICVEALGDQIRDANMAKTYLTTEMLFLLAVAELFRTEQTNTDIALALRKELNHLEDHGSFTFDNVDAQDQITS